ncbi:MAG: hypothetical protein IJY39_08000 [Clostridia bacterium]|nr:hypothetical protein [Clostridia bacterium]
MMIKRRMRSFAAWLVLCLLILWAGAVSVGAEDGEEHGTMPEEYGSFIDSLPDTVSDILPDGAESSDSDAVSDAAQRVSNPEYLLSVLGELLEESVGRLLPTLSLLCGTVILAAVMYLLGGCFAAGTNKTVELCVRLSTYCVIAEVSVASLLHIEAYFQALLSAVASFLPLSGVLYAMGGNLTAAASASASLSVILAVCEFFCAKTVIPVFCVCLSLSMLSAFDGAGALVGQNLSGRIRKWYTTSLGFVMMLLTTALGAQSIITAKADGIAMRGVKLAVSGFVPISGGTVSSTLGTMAASVELIRGSVGVIGMISLLLMLLPVLLELAVMRGILSLAAFVAGMLGCGSEQRLLGELEGLYGYLEGVAVLAAAVFLIAMGIFATTASAVG